MMINQQRQIVDKVAFIKANSDLIRSPLVKMQSMQFNSCLSDEAITCFEQNQKVILPADYKFFLTRVGNGGFGPGYGLLPLQESNIDFKLNDKPQINLVRPFRLTESWNEEWIANFDWQAGLPAADLVNSYMDVSHIDGCLQIAHFGHGCTFLLVVNGHEKGYIWFDGRADYGGIAPELNGTQPVSFLQWYLAWLDNVLMEISR